MKRRVGTDLEAAVWRMLPPRSYKRWREFKANLRAAWRMLFTRAGRAYRREYGLYLWPRKRIRIRTRGDFGQLYDRVWLEQTRKDLREHPEIFEGLRRR